MKLPTYELRPTWYEIGVNPRAKEPILQIRIHSEVMEHLHTYCRAGLPIADSLEKEHGLTPYVPSTENEWGFGSCLKFLDSGEPDWRLIEIAIPEGDHTDKYPYKHTQVMDVRSSLGILFMALWMNDKETSAKNHQLIVIDAMQVLNEMHGGEMSVSLTPAMIKFLRVQQEHSYLKKVQDVMRRTYYHIWPTSRSSLDRFEALCRQPKWINFNVPGNACGLDPKEYSDDERELGYELLTHNTDSGLQQLTLIMGLAALHDQARQANY